ncbi:hypothetical protein D3C85_768040 [compost metagenome]
MPMKSSGLASMIRLIAASSESVFKNDTILWSARTLLSLLPVPFLTMFLALLFIFSFMASKCLVAKASSLFKLIILQVFDFFL